MLNTISTSATLLQCLRRMEKVVYISYNVIIIIK